jgi:hypothetical protein
VEASDASADARPNASEGIDKVARRWNLDFRSILKERPWPMVRPARAFLARSFPTRDQMSRIWA